MEIPGHIQEELDRLVEDYRTRCLWSLRPDFLPRTLSEAREVLRQIETHGDLEAFRRVARLKPWLSPPSSARSAGS